VKMMFKKSFWHCDRLDATNDDGSLGRLCNDSNRSPNANMKIIVDSGRPHLCLFAVRDIAQGEEIRYCYGKGVKFPWRVCFNLA
jgi:SET domain-containing protein